jgi:UPF0716 family protein affecting phage T7 exclusion
MLYFLVYLFLEVLVSVSISSSLGGLMTFFEIILSALIGIALLVNFRQTLVENFTSLANNAIDIEQFQKLNLFTLLGAVLLIIPGFLTDIVGVLMQFSVLTTMLVNRYNVKSENRKTNFQQTHIKKDSNVIDVEIISDNPSIK